MDGENCPLIFLSKFLVDIGLDILTIVPILEKFGNVIKTYEAESPDIKLSQVLNDLYIKLQPLISNDLKDSSTTIGYAIIYIAFLTTFFIILVVVIITFIPNSLSIIILSSIVGVFYLCIIILIIFDTRNTINNLTTTTKQQIINIVDDTINTLDAGEKQEDKAINDALCAY